MANRILALIVVFCCTALVDAADDPFKRLTKNERREAIRRAQVWLPVNVADIDFKSGPRDVPGFPPNAAVTCDFVAKDTGSGKTPKFLCAVASDDEVKVKYGEDNGEVYAEVAATRLLWALGFGADRMYPVVVACRGCSADPFKDGLKVAAGSTTFDPAALERPLPGDVMESRKDEGWDWIDLSFVDQTGGGAPLAHRDALKLLAAFIQHTDSKPQQQKVICLDRAKGIEPTAKSLCAHPFLMVSDLGVTFGKANVFNKSNPGSVNLKAWANEPIWKGDKGCQANISKSMTGTLEHPKISEGGRKFLANLLSQLSDQQIRDLFEVSRFTRRDKSSTLEGWVDTFKQKRNEIVTRSCAA